MIIQTEWKTFKELPTNDSILLILKYNNKYVIGNLNYHLKQGEQHLKKDETGEYYIFSGKEFRTSKIVHDRLLDGKETLMMSNRHEYKCYVNDPNIMWDYLPTELLKGEI